MLLPSLSKRKRGVLEVMSKPKIPVELQEQMGLKKNNNISSTIKELMNVDIIHCLTPKVQVGRLYALTNKGKRVRKKLLIQNGKPYNYYEPLNINWNLYGWIICGRQRRTILKGLSRTMPLKYIKEKAQDYNPRISRTNCNDILQLFIRKGVARKIRHKNRVNFVLTKCGQVIRAQLLEP